MAKDSALSIRPEDFSKGGGLIDDVDATIKQARWVVYDYNGKAPNTTCAHVVFTVEGEAGAEDHDSYYGIGKEGTKSFIPSNDGKTLKKIGQKDSLSDGCSFFQFISSVVNAGFPADSIEGSDISFLDGLFVHVKREQQPERKGLAKDPTDTRDKTTLCISKIYDKKGGKAKPVAARPAATAGGTTTAKPNGSAAAADDLDNSTAEAVIGVLAQAGAGVAVTKPQLSQKMFALLKGNPNANKMITLAFKDEFLAAEGRPWVFTGTEVMLAG